MSDNQAYPSNAACSTTLVEYAVVKANTKYGPQHPMGTPWHINCLSEWNGDYIRKHFSIGEIDPAKLAGKRCGYCNDDWTPDPKRMEPFPGEVATACLCCPPKPQTLPHDFVIAVGFGMADVTRDGETVLDGEEAYGDPDQGPVTVADAERVAALDPDHDWRIRMYGPMRGQEYQRHGKGQWVYVKRVPGFA